MLDKSSKIYVAGHHGLVGSAIWNNLKRRGYCNLIGRTHSELDLTDQLAVKRFFDEEQPDAVVLAAAFVGGIMANSLYRADFIMQNMKIQCNVIEQAYKHHVKKLLFLGSTCIYPKNAPQPMKEGALLTSPLEYTNEEYAISKIAGLKMCESYNLQYGTNYIAVMPTNLYGPNDNFHLENSHVMPAIAFRHIANDTRQPSDMVAIRTHLLGAEIHFTTLWALDNLSRYSHATARAKWCLVAYLSPTLRAFNHCHNTSLYCFVIFYLCLNRISLSLCFPMKRLLSTKPFMPSSLPFAVYCHNRYSLPSVRTGCRDEYCAIMSL